MVSISYNNYFNLIANLNICTEIRMKRKAIFFLKALMYSNPYSNQLIINRNYDILNVILEFVKK